MGITKKEATDPSNNGKGGLIWLLKGQNLVQNFDSIFVKNSVQSGSLSMSRTGLCYLAGAQKVRFIQNLYLRPLEEHRYIDIEIKLKADNITFQVLRSDLIVIAYTQIVQKEPKIGSGDPKNGQKDENSKRGDFVIEVRTTLGDLIHLMRLESKQLTHLHISPESALGVACLRNSQKKFELILFEISSESAKKCDSYSLESFPSFRLAGGLVSVATTVDGINFVVVFPRAGKRAKIKKLEVLCFVIRLGRLVLLEVKEVDYRKWMLGLIWSGASDSVLGIASKTIFELGFSGYRVQLPGKEVSYYDSILGVTDGGE